MSKEEIRTSKNLNDEDKSILDELDSLFDEIDHESDDATKDLLGSLEGAIDGTEESKIDYDEETQSFLDELSVFLDEEETNLLDDDLPNLDEIERAETTKKIDDDDRFAYDDPETARTRREAADIAIGLVNFVEYHVVILENELTILGDAFNNLLDKTYELDDKIAKLIEYITNAKIEGSKQALNFIHEEIRLISDNIEGALKSTNPYDREVLEQNVDILKENEALIKSQIAGLKEIGASTASLEKDLEILASSIRKLEAAIASNKVFSIATSISNELAQIKTQINDSRSAEDIEDVKLLQENFDVLMENKANIEQKMWDVAAEGADIETLNEYIDVLNIDLEQFSRIIDETAHRIYISSRNR